MPSVGPVTSDKNVTMVASPDFTKPFLLNAVVMDNKITGHLLQCDDRKQNRLVVLTYSRLITTDELNYSPVELSVLALIVCCQAFKEIIVGNKVFVVSDPSALNFLKLGAMMSTRLKNWASYIQQFNLEIYDKNKFSSNQQ